MKDYKDIVSKVVDATSDIQDEKLKEIAFQKLLEHSLSPGSYVTKRRKRGVSKSLTSRAKGSRKRSATTKNNGNVIREDVKTAFEEVTANMPNLKPLGSLKQKWEKYIWVLVAAKEKGVDIMTNAEIAYVLTEKFSEGATEKTVNNLTNKVQSGHVQKRDLDGKRAWKVLIGGIEAIKQSKNGNGDG